jgi:hypothetical protein
MAMLTRKDILNDYDVDSDGIIRSMVAYCPSLHAHCIVIKQRAATALVNFGFSDVWILLSELTLPHKAQP